MPKTILAIILTSIALTTTASAHEGFAVPDPSRGGQAVPETNVEIGQRLAADAGWYGPEWSCLYALWNRESGWQVSDPNPASYADGIAQANPASKYGPGWQGNARQQIAWGLVYIAERYGSPCNAWANSNAYGYY